MINVTVIFVIGDPSLKSGYHAYAFGKYLDSSVLPSAMS